MQRQTIARALFVETGTYNDMTSRPYQTSTVTAPILHQFQEATNNGQFLAASNLSGIAGHFIKPSAEPEKDQYGNNRIVGIANGWNTSRLRFMLDVYTPSNFGMLRQIVTGYTDFTGVANNGAMAQDMVLFINNVITLRSVEDIGAQGRQVRTTVADASHLLSGAYQPGFGGGHISYTMRPEDVFAKMSTLDLADDVLDTRPTFATGHKKSKRSNGNVSNYISNILRSYKSTTEDDMNSACDMVAMLDSARGLVKEGDLASDQFLYNLQRNTSFQEGGSVRFGELLSFFPELNDDNITKVQLARGSLLQETHQQGQTEHWNGNTMETVASTALAHSVPSLMMEYMLTRVQFMATNRTLNGDFDVVIAGCRAFAEGIDLTPYLQKFIERLKVEVLRGLSSNNMLDFEITMLVDILGETRVDISMQGGPMIQYAIPSFCDALFVPVMTEQEGTLRNLAHDMNQLADTIGVSHYDQYASNPHAAYGVNNGTTGTDSAI